MNQGPDKKALAVLGVISLLLLAYVAMGVMQGEANAAEITVMECAERLVPQAPAEAMCSAARTAAETAPQEEAVEEPEAYVEEYAYQEAGYAAYEGPQAVYPARPEYTMDGNGVVHAEYSEAYNTDGPSAERPGWHEGFLETWYIASNHYLASTWTVDDEGFYHDENGRYVVGVEIHHQYDMPYGTVVETGKGEGVVYDYGAGWEVHDFATIW